MPKESPPPTPNKERATPFAIRHVFPRGPTETTTSQLEEWLADVIYTEFVAWEARQRRADELSTLQHDEG
jgi:hypothetical protein